MPYLKRASHFKLLPLGIVEGVEKATTFHTLNRELGRIFDFADENLIWIEL